VTVTPDIAAPFESWIAPSTVAESNCAKAVFTAETSNRHRNGIRRANSLLMVILMSLLLIDGFVDRLRPRLPNSDVMLRNRDDLQVVPL
jgi:hypothetical protein